MVGGIFYKELNGIKGIKLWLMHLKLIKGKRERCAGAGEVLGARAEIKLECFPMTQNINCVAGVCT